MKAIIPVAGAGTKLRPHTYTQPKALIPIAGKTILSFIVDQLYDAGIKEFIFCTGSPGFKKIIERLPSVPKHTRVRFFTPGSHSVIGSYDKNTSGRITGDDPLTFNLSNRFYRRSKRLTDAGTCLFFLLTFPFHLLIKRRPGIFFNNVFLVLTGKYTWVGYASPGTSLPRLSKGVITPTGLPSDKNILSAEALKNSDSFYAKHYSVEVDLHCSGGIIMNFPDYSQKDLITNKPINWLTN